MSAWESFVWIILIFCVTAIVMQRRSHRHELDMKRGQTK